MSPEAQRIAIAEACGWIIPDWCISKRRARGEKERNLKGATPDFGTAPASWALHTPNYGLPDFTRDLNAMHEAEKTLTEEQRDKYPMHLLHIVWRPENKQIPPPEGGWWKVTTYEFPLLLTANAAQRAEAFLRAKGIWRDTP